MTTPKKKLIEVALPLDAINKASAREKALRHGHPSTLHLWWARRPLAAARAVIFAQMVDDPSSYPDLFPTAKAQDKERQRLFHLIEALVQWESTNDEKILEAAREEIRQSWRRTCAEHSADPRAKELFDRNRLPEFHDPFAGGGALPLEAQRLGLQACASDLNPVAVLINRAMIEIPPRFSGRPPVSRTAQGDLASSELWAGNRGLAEDVRAYGKWMRDEAQRRIGHFYPAVEVTSEMARARPDLAPLVGRSLGVVAWLWARTVKSPNPAFGTVEVPLVSTFMLSTKNGNEAYVEPIVEGNGYQFTVKLGKPKDATALRNGTRAGKAQDFLCLMSGASIPRSYIRSEGQAGRLGARLMAIVAEGEKGRILLPPTKSAEITGKSAANEALVEEARKGFLSITTPTRAMITGGVCSAYGLSTYGDIFTDRQLVAVTTFADLVDEARKRILADARRAGWSDDGRGFAEGGLHATAYADALAVYLAFGVDKLADRHSSLTRWDPTPTASGIINTFSRQALPMTWDFAEGNPFSESSGNFEGGIAWIQKVIAGALSGKTQGTVFQADAATQELGFGKVISTDPPYYDNIGYADLSDFFYVWLRRSLRPAFPQLFPTVAVPKAEELVATPYRHGSQEKAEAFFLKGMSKAMVRLAEQSHPAIPVTIYYAFKQTETDAQDGSASTGWDTFLDAVIRAGFAISGTWPIRTELANRMIGAGANALASSIVLVCRPRGKDAPTATRRDFVSMLKSDLPRAVAHLQRGNIAPVDLAQAAIGPGMEVFTRYKCVLDADGQPLPVREALSLINQVLDEALAEQEGDFDADSRWALAWHEQSGFAEGEFGVADVLARAKNTSVAGLVEAGILKSSKGKVRLLKPEELPADWEPSTDNRLTTWEMVHHLIRALNSGGELAAAALVVKLGGKAETARELAYRLYTLCERKKRAQEALAYNGLVQSWPEITRLAREGSKPKPGAQGGLFDKGGE